MEMKDWVIGAAVAAVSPMIFSWAKRRIGAALAQWTTNELTLALKNIDKVEDLDIKEYLETVLRAHVKLAERKIPGQGRGVEKKQYVVDTIKSHFPMLKVHDKVISEVIDSICDAEKAALLKFENKPPA